jgi:hypothetical protein
MRAITSNNNEEKNSMALIAIMIYIEIVSYFGVIWFMGVMQKRGRLTEQFFAIVQVGYISVITLTGFLVGSLTWQTIVALVVIIIIYWILGYPFARWAYRQLFSPK